MQRLLAVALGILLSLELPTARADAPPKKEKVDLLLGEIIVIGNTVTPMDIIVQQVPVRPGDVIRSHHLRMIERNLDRLRIFRGKPQVEFHTLEGDACYRNVLIRVEEIRKPGLGLDFLGGLEDATRDSLCGQMLHQLEGTWGTSWKSALALLFLESSLDCAGNTLRRMYFFFSHDWAPCIWYSLPCKIRGD